ncbi:MAG: DUF167 domain-containing protein [Halobacteriota archaeon]
MTYEPEDAVDETENGALLRVRVNPGSDTNEVKGFDEWRGRYEVRVSEPAEEGRANREVERYLSEVFDAEVRLRSGARSRDKAVSVAVTPEELLEALEQRAG